MRVSHRIEVCRLHQANILEHRGFVNDMPRGIVMLVQVHALQANVLAINKESRVYDFDRAKADLLRDRFTAACNQ